MTPPRLPVLKAVRDVLTEDVGKPARLMRVRMETDTTTGKDTDVPVIPSMVVYPGAGTSLSGPGFGDATADANFVVLIRSIAKDPSQLEWISDKVRGCMLDKDDDGQWRVPILVDGLVVGGRELDSDSPPDVAGTIWSLSQTFGLWLTPSDTP